MNLWRGGEQERAGEHAREGQDPPEAHRLGSKGDWAMWLGLPPAVFGFEGEGQSGW